MSTRRALPLDKDRLRRELDCAGVTITSETELAELQESFLRVDERFTLHFDDVASDDHFLGKALELADFLDPIINRKILHIVESNGSGVFVTSDIL
jgi:hypothetical protein